MMQRFFRDGGSVISGSRAVSRFDGTVWTARVEYFCFVSTLAVGEVRFGKGWIHFFL
jgi:hypothetical protein